jgi:hypothetical protein
MKATCTCHASNESLIRLLVRGQLLIWIGRELVMLRITRVEDQPFYLLPHRTSGPTKGKVRRNQLPFYRAYATGLPDTIEALAFTSDLQGRGASGRGRRLRRCW